MKIAGIQKLTLLDFPGHTACTVFLPGCNMRCGYCHNQELVLPEQIKEIADSLIEESAFFNFLEKRKGLLDGVCITGGEPTLHQKLPEFIKKIKTTGFKVKLDSNGTNFEMLNKLIETNLLDYIAMDIKTSLEKYQELTKIPETHIENIKKSKKLIMNSKIDYEFRTTIVKETHSEKEISLITDFIKGAKKYFLQNFQNKGGCIDPKFNNYQNFSEEELEKLKTLASKKVKYCGVRQ